MAKGNLIEDGDGRKDVIVINRRSFFAVLLGIGSAGMGALLAVPVLRYVLYPVYAKVGKGDWSPAGSMAAFSNLNAPVLKAITLQQRDGWREVVSPQSVYITRGQDGKLAVLSSICPHLGCGVAWQDSKKEFFCPCHGSRFAPDGHLIAGPAPRGMDPLPHRVEQGNLLVHFQYFRADVSNREVLG